MTSVAVVERSEAVGLDRESEVAHSIQSLDWEKEMKGAAFLFKSGLCPATIKSAEAALFIILTGRDLGLSAVQSLRSIHVIQGKIELAADQQLALFKRRGGRATWLTLTDTEATCRFIHPNGDEHTESFTMKDAQRAGIATGNYNKYPRAMLRSRCITAGLKSMGFDATAGMYDEGELGGQVTSPLKNPAPVTPETGPKDDDDVSRETVSAEVVEESLEDAPTEAQLALLTKMLKSHVFSNEDRDSYRIAGEDCSTKRELADLLDTVIQHGKRLKAEEKQRSAAEGTGTTAEQE